jgi:hypothetical protein
MADVNLFPKKSMCPAEVTLSAVFAMDGTNAPTIVESNGVASIAYGGSAGKFVVTLKNKWMACKGASLSFQAATAVDLVPQFRAIDVTTTSTVTFELLTGATATNAPAAASNVTYVYLTLQLRNSAVKGA